MATGDVDYLPLSLAGPSTSMEDLEMKMEAGSQPASSRTSFSEEAMDTTQFFSDDEEYEEEISDQDEQADSDLEAN